MDTLSAFLRSPGIPLTISELPSLGVFMLMLLVACPHAVGVPLPLQGGTQEFTSPVLASDQLVQECGSPASFPANS